MKIQKMMFIALAALTACCSAGTIVADSATPEHDSGEAETLSWLREFSK